MSNQFQFTVSEFELMYEAAKKIDENLADLKKISETLTNQVIPSLDNYWTGEARSVFLLKYGVIEHLMQDILTVYSELNTDLVRAADQYKNAEIESHYLANHWR